MLRPFTLRFRVYSVLIALVLITIMGGVVMVWYTYRMEGLLSQLIDRNLAAFQTAEALQSALVNQKGFVSYYFQDSDQTWLRHLEEYRRKFDKMLKEAVALAQTETERRTVERIESEYMEYTNLKDKVIGYYIAGEREKGVVLHKQARDHFFKVLQLCDEYKTFHAVNIGEVKDRSLSQAGRLRVISGSAILCVLFLAVLLSFVLVHQILGPVRRLAFETDPDSSNPGTDDEVMALSRSVRGLLEEFDFTQTELERSREHLVQSEKMVALGKLSASMAHSIRNPLTSVKMRLFSLQRKLELTALQKEDFQVISEEILHIDAIVQNFLEFSRPPRLRMQEISLSDIVDHATRLLSHRFELAGVKCRIDREEPLPQIQGDPERLKEVFVNLLENACEAMVQGGNIVIQEEAVNRSAKAIAAVVRVSDDGPGIQEAVRKRIFEPFFSTREEGTGLGLSIARRIVREHGGTLDLAPQKSVGTTFILTLPTKERSVEHDSNH
ncbi:MAG: histidine kinase [Desulfobacteraceae bacterium]|nr:MAG: histidine kinase [Desulfobacteraceae bacterium]